MPVHAPDGGQTVRNHKDRAAGHQMCTGLHQRFGFVVQRGSGFRQNQDGGVLQERAAMAMRWLSPPEDAAPFFPMMVS